MWTSTNFTAEGDDYNESQKLVRYEFLEILVRIAGEKFVKHGNLSQENYARALHKLVNEHILPVVNQQRLPSWAPFRTKYLW